MDGTESTLFWFWLGSAPKLHQRPSVATGQLDSTGQDWRTKGGRSEGEKERHPSVFLELTGLGWVYCREKEVGRRERGWVKDDRWAARCMSYRVAESVPVCLSVLTLSKSICPLWNCGHREGEASRWAGSGETTANTKPGHTQTQKPRLPSDMTSITYKFNWIWASF